MQTQFPIYVKDKNYHHPSFPSPSPETKIWRYMEWYKFEWLLTYKKLLMPTVPLLGDSREGTTPEGEDQKWKKLERPASTPENLIQIQQYKNAIDHFAQSLQKGYFVSCWHMNSEEIPTQWNDFIPVWEDENDPVAISTTFECLKKALPEHVEVGMVKYINYEGSDLFYHEGHYLPNMYEWIMTKDKKYEWEKEVRAVASFSNMKFLHDQNVLFKERRKVDLENVFECEKTKKLVYYAPPIELTRFLHSVHVRPNAPETHIARVKNLLKGIGMEKTFFQTV